MATLMSADSALTAAQHSWFTAQAILLAAGVVGVVVCARLKSSAAVLAMTAVVVIAAELAGRIAFTICGRCQCSFLPGLCHVSLISVASSGEIFQELLLCFPVLFCRVSSAHCFTTP